MDVQRISGEIDLGEPQADGDPGPIESCPSCCTFPCSCGREFGRDDDDEGR